MPETSAREEQFLVLAPTGRDAPLTCQLLERAGLEARTCTDFAELCEIVAREGAAAVMIAQEALTPAGVDALRALLDRQEAWSDLPVLLFMSSREISGAPSLEVLAPLGNVTLLDRPVRTVTMQSAARAALRARRRQYAARAELRAQQEAVRQRDQFLAMLGHELRNPLASVALAIERLESDQRVDRYREILRHQTVHLARLVDDLLDVSRVTSGKIVLARAPVDLGELVASVVEPRLTVAARQGLELRFAPAPGPVAVHGDPVRLEQIVANLLDNAIKYTPAGGAIDVAVRVDGGDAVVCVRDNGVGIAPDMIDRIFDLFAQVDGSLARARGGMGIGLTLVRRLVELHGGQVVAESEGLGRGARFTVRLALVTDAVRPAPTRRAAITPARPHAVLVVEDNADSRELLVELLAECGHHVEAAADGPAGVAIALERPPRVALIDIGLPGKDGYQVAREVREALGDAVLLIAMTGYGQPEDQARAREAGFDLHMTKPVDAMELRRVIADVEPVARGVSGP